MLASADGGTVRASNGMWIGADLSFDKAAGPWDIALVAGGPALPEGRMDEKLLARLRMIAAGQLAGRFPAARVEPDRIVCRDGALITSAGVTAGIDLALTLVAEDHGAALALMVAKRLVVVAQRQGGQASFARRERQ